MTLYFIIAELTALPGTWTEVEVCRDPMKAAALAVQYEQQIELFLNVLVINRAPIEPLLTLLHEPAPLKIEWNQPEDPAKAWIYDLCICTLNNPNHPLLVKDVW